MPKNKIGGKGFRALRFFVASGFYLAFFECHLTEFVFTN